MLTFVFVVMTGFNCQGQVQPTASPAAAAQTSQTAGQQPSPIPTPGYLSPGQTTIQAGPISLQVNRGSAQGLFLSNSSLKKITETSAPLLNIDNTGVLDQIARQLKASPPINTPPKNTFSLEGNKGTVQWAPEPSGTRIFVVPTIPSAEVTSDLYAVVPNYHISLDPQSRKALCEARGVKAAECASICISTNTTGAQRCLPTGNVRLRVPVRVHLQNDSVIDLEREDWILESTDQPTALLTIGEEKTQLCPCPRTTAGSDSCSIPVTLQDIADNQCHLEFALLRRIEQRDVILAATVTRTGVVPQGTTPRDAAAAEYPVQTKVTINPEALQDTDQVITVNDKVIKSEPGFPREFDNSSSITIGVRRQRFGCRLFSAGLDEEWGTVHFYPLLGPLPNKAKDRGITVGPGKIFDSFSLSRMLNDTASQLAAISGFNSAVITSAFTNLQGVTRDTSFLAAQVTTTPLPSISSTVSGTNGTSGTTTTSTPIAGAAAGTVTLVCPDGSLPTIGSGGLQQCAAVPSGSNITGSTSTITTIPVSTNQQVNGANNSTQNSTTTTQQSVTPTIPVAPASTAFAAPSNVGLSSSDILAEQVQLNAEITTLRLLLQGAKSDQYLTTNSRAIATRQQTTIGFAVSLDPLRQFKHAVAEVRIIIIPPPGRDGVSIMNLLPAEKTYNVAKITSHQDSFGAGVAVEPVTVGASTGRAKDRLYLAKDTDTLALQYASPEVRALKRPYQQQTHDRVKGVFGFMRLHELDPCAEDITDGLTNAVVFGWQFRPVLGADYVKGGLRQVFAQLALPVDSDEPFIPTVFVQSRWREYDPKRQVVGEIYKDSCTISQDLSGISLLSPLVVRDFEVTDIGNGTVRLRAHGDFFAPAMTVRSGPNNVVPTMFDGKAIEAFASVHDVLQAGELTLVSQAGKPIPFVGKTNPDREDCGIDKATLIALPQPDGNSRAEMNITLGKDYDIGDDADGEPQPFVLIGSQVYGLQETPFSAATCTQDSGQAKCTYKFIAPTASLRNAQTFLVRDIGREVFSQSGTIRFAPSFTSLSVLSQPSDSNSSQDAANKQKPKPPAPPKNKVPDSNLTSLQASPRPTPTPSPAPALEPTVYAVAGFDFSNLTTCQAKSSSEVPEAVADIDLPDKYCIQLLVANKPQNNFEPHTSNLGIITLLPKDTKSTKAVQVQVLDPANGHPLVEWNLALPKADDATAKATASPAFVRAGSGEQITFSGGGLANADAVQSVFFETGCDIPAVQPNDFDKGSLKIQIPTCVTKLPGHKDFHVNIIKKDTKKADVIVVGIDVYKE